MIRNPSEIYGAMPTDAIMGLPIPNIASENAALLLWATWPLLTDALRVIEAWGFSYRTGFPWVKMTRAAVPKRGTGFHVSQCTEPLLIATRGKGMCPPLDSPKPMGVIFNPAGRHSAKPEAQYDYAERYPGPYLEIFARPDGGLFPPRDGWTRIGNEITGRDIREDLELLAALSDKQVGSETTNA